MIDFLFQISIAFFFGMFVGILIACLINRKNDNRKVL